jgi:hypothetical protein
MQRGTTVAIVLSSLVAGVAFTAREARRYNEEEETRRRASAEEARKPKKLPVDEARAYTLTVECLEESCPRGDELATRFEHALNSHMAPYGVNHYRLGRWVGDAGAIKVKVVALKVQTYQASDHSKTPAIPYEMAAAISVDSWYATSTWDGEHRVRATTSPPSGVAGGKFFAAYSEHADALVKDAVQQLANKTIFRRDALPDAAVPSGPPEG